MASGSVFKRGDRPRGTKRWVAQIDLAPDPATGRRRYKQTYHRTREEAREALSTMQEADRRGELRPAAGPVTFAACVADWLAAGRERWRPTVEYEYRMLLAKHATPALGPVRVDHLTAQHLARLTARLADDGVGPFPRRTVYRLVRSVLAQAVRRRLVGRNVALDVDPPPAPHPVRPRVWSADEARRFLAGARTDADYALWVLLVTSGCRLGEVLALAWADVDEARGTVTIRRTVGEVPRRGYVFGDPKTAAGRRTISLPPAAFAALRAHRARVAAARLRRGAAWADLDLVFPATRYAPRAGAPRNRRAVLERFHVLTDRLGLPRTRLHGLRHFHATDLFRRGAHPKAVQGRLGHATVGITMDLYTEHLPEVDRALAADLADLVPAPDADSPAVG